VWVIKIKFQQNLLSSSGYEKCEQMASSPHHACTLCIILCRNAGIYYISYHSLLDSVTTCINWYCNWL